MNRGPDYAHELTDSERRILVSLLRRVAVDHVLPPEVAQLAATRDGPDDDVRDPAAVPGRGRPGRRGWLGVTAVAAAVAAIALGGGLLPQGLAPGRAHLPSAPASTPSLSAVDILGELAAAARLAGPSVADTQTSLVTVAVAKNGVCGGNTYQVSTTTRAAPGWPEVTLRIGRVGTPELTATWLPCSTPPGGTSPARYEKVFEGTTADGQAGWSNLLEGVRKAVLLPDLIDPRSVPDGLLVASLSADPVALAPALAKAGTVSPGGAAGWWAAMARLLASPLCSAALRSSALELAADRARSSDVTVVTDHPGDSLGRSGVTIRVPYTVDGVAGHADLTFDRRTAAVLQRTVYGAPGEFWSTLVTAYGAG
jgi:hypothetical protein